jgi:hypothetical protein
MTKASSFTHQLNIILRQPPQRLRLRGSDRALMVRMTQLWPSLLGLARIVQPATILRWHRAGFRSYWRWKSQGGSGRPRIEHELRDLIRRMSKENPLWGAPRIHGELLKLGFEVAESTAYRRFHRPPYLVAAVPEPSTRRAGRRRRGRLRTAANWETPGGDRWSSRDV